MLYVGGKFQFNAPKQKSADQQRGSVLLNSSIICALVALSSQLLINQVETTSSHVHSNIQNSIENRRLSDAGMIAATKIFEDPFSAISTFECSNDPRLKMAREVGMPESNYPNFSNVGLKCHMKDKYHPFRIESDYIGPHSEEKTESIKISGPPICVSKDFSFESSGSPTTYISIRFNEGLLNKNEISWSGGSSAPIINTTCSRSDTSCYKWSGASTIGFSMPCAAGVTSINFSNAKITALNDTFEKYRMLDDISLRVNFIDGFVGDSFKGLRLLKSLDFYNNKIGPTLSGNLFSRPS
jgi:hypothetical protein